MRSAPVTPSMAAWCIFVTIASWPSSRPSTTHSSQSGRVRSSGRPAMSPTISASSCIEPGVPDGRAVHVVLDVEVGILDPDRVGQVERHR